ncbi:Uncharacterised protein [Vibrio cholerae]|nr:Uncharacterised protein [Vibrio cholerae]CSI63438.1 Uncharacterised protein [Vibrio cholerae]
MNMSTLISCKPQVRLVNPNVLRSATVICIAISVKLTNYFHSMRKIEWGNILI